MSDQSTSGNTPSEGRAETASAPAAPAADWGASSGANRGSGLARGKRVSPPASTPAPVSNAVTGTYKPSAVQIVTSESEYKNPFAPADEVPVSEPVKVEAPVPVTVAPAPVVSVAKSEEAPASAPVAPVAAPVQPAPAPKVEEKAELNILPPAELKRPSQSWETPAFPYEGNSAPQPRREQASAASPVGAPREVFKPVRRSEVPMLESAPNAGGPKDSRRDPRDQRRQPRDPRDNRGSNQQPRDSRNFDRKPAPAPAAEAPKKAGGVVGWFKGLFASAPATTEKSAQPGQPGQQPHGDRPSEGNRRRRHRGGRGRNGGGVQGAQGGGENRGPRPEGHNPNHGGHGQTHGQSQGDQPHGGGGRRRRRGGRGRNGGGPRPEGGGGGQTSAS
ncbi:MAG: translation initiation factor IF-2 [Verrucomicrobia bacterium]|nr:translation initiation factor IF-2 [Verrucomicrobiota bacterium]